MLTTASSNAASTIAVQISVAPEGAVNHAGIAFASAKIRCTNAAHLSGSARLTEVLSNRTISATAALPTTIACDGTWRTISLAFVPGTGRFVPGPATYGVGFLACASGSCRRVSPPTATIRLRRTS